MLHRLLLACAFVSAPLLASANVAITSGATGGTYHGVYGQNLSQILKERGHTVEVMTSAGSVENIRRVASGEAQVGFAQADALAYTSQREDTNAAMILGSLGQECIYVAVADNGPIDDEDDLEHAKIAVGAEGSGSAVTWHYAQSLEDDYANASTHYVGGALALGQVKAGRLDAFLWVTSPTNLNHKFLQIVRGQNSGLRLIDFDDYDINDTLDNGQQVYEFRDVDVEAGAFADDIETACTDVLVLANDAQDTQAIDDLATAVLMNANRITGQ